MTWGIMRQTGLPCYKVGTIRGRHPLPVERFLLDEQDLSFFEDLAEKTRQAVRRMWEGEGGMPFVNLYITGLTRVTLTAIEEFRQLGSWVEVYEWDKESQSYISTLSYTPFFQIAEERKAEEISRLRRGKSLGVDLAEYVEPLREALERNDPKWLEEIVRAMEGICSDYLKEGK